MAPGPTDEPGTDIDAEEPGTDIDAEEPGTGIDAEEPGTDIDADGTIELARELVRIPSPYFEEAEIAEFVSGWLADRDLDPRFHQVSEPSVREFEGRNVVARLPGTDPDAPCVLLNGHMDTVQIVEGWEKDPFSGHVEEGKLYGQGACDMKGGLAAAMTAFEALSRMDSRRGDVLFTAVVDEEGPYGLGTDRLIRDGVLDDCDMAIVPEPGPLLAQQPVEHPALMLGARGRFLVEITVQGRAAHGSRPERGRNAVVAASRIAAAVEEMDVGSHPDLGEGSVCPLSIEGGSETLSVPETARVLVDRHVVVGETRAGVLQEFEALIDSLDLDVAVDVGIRSAPEPEMFYGPYVTSADHPLVTALEAATRSQTGREPALGYFSSVGDFNYLGDRVGLPTVIVGPGGGNIHAAGEFVYTQDLLDVARILADGVSRLVG